MRNYGLDLRIVGRVGSGNERGVLFDRNDVVLIEHEHK